MTGVIGRDAPAMRRFHALGTTAVLITTCPSALSEAESILRHQLVSIDLACSRFRTDSEISAVHRADGKDVIVSRLLADAIEVALSVAEATDGAVDPTVGTSLVSLGYDRDFDQIRSGSLGQTLGARVPRGWRSIEFDARSRRLRVPADVVVDLGATAKALAADRAAAAAAAATGSGVLINLGGDIAVTGEAPPGGWAVGLALDCSTEDASATIAIESGGLASSGIAVRAWRAGDRQVHHIIDPKTGDSAGTCWQLVSVAARTCVEANAASTAALVWGEDAVARLTVMGLPCRLLRDDGTVVTLGGWPEDRPRPVRRPLRRRACHR